MFPTPYTVVQIPFSAMAVDDMGSDSPTYGTPITRRAYGWSAADIQQAQHGHTERDIANITLEMPPTPVDLLDLFVVDGRTYFVSELQDSTKGFHRWRPGIVVLLNVVTG